MLLLRWNVPTYLQLVWNCLENNMCICQKIDYPTKKNVGHHHVLSSTCRGMSPPINIDTHWKPAQPDPTSAPRDSSRCHGGLNILSQTRPSPPIRWCRRPAIWLRRRSGVLDNNSWIKYESQLGLLFPIYGEIIAMFQTTNQITFFTVKLWTIGKTASKKPYKNGEIQQLALVKYTAIPAIPIVIP